MKLLLATALMVCASAPAHAQQDGKKIDYSVSSIILSDYVFRGISQTDEKPAVWVEGIARHNPTGLYFGVWGSNVDFDDGDEATIEMNVFTGIRGKFAEKAGYDLEYRYFVYPGADEDLNYDAWELTPALNYDAGFASLTGKVSYSPDFFASAGESYYKGGIVDFPLPAKFGLALSGGHQSFEDNDQIGIPDYYDWAIGLRKSFSRFTGTISYTDTDVSEEECGGGLPICGERAIISLAHTFAE